MAGNVLLSEQTMTPEQISSHWKAGLKGSEEHDSLTVPSHPLRIKPAGNAYTATENIKLAAGLFMGLPDELIIQVLEPLDATSLKRLGCTCKALYAFSRLEDLWKTLCVEYELPSPGQFLAPCCCNFHLELRGRNIHSSCPRLAFFFSSVRGRPVHGMGILLP